MDPRDPHFNRSRFDPYNPPFHHRNTDLSGPPDVYYPHPPLPPPPPRQHLHPRDHFNHHPDDPRVYFPHPPDRPPFDPTVPARSAIRGPNPHRLAEPWVGPTDPRRVRDFDVRRVVDPPERYWTGEDESLEEDFRVRFVDDRPGGCRFEQFAPDAQELEYYPRVRHPGFVPRPDFERVPVVEASNAVGLGMGTEIGFRGDRYQEDDYYHGNRYQVDHYVVNKGKKRMADMGYEGHDFRENHFVGNPGKKRNFNGGDFQYNEQSTMKRLVQKTSALGRIQSGVSVWNRIEEKPASPSPVNLNDLGFIEEDQPDVEILDLSYKSNALVAKVTVPSSSSPMPAPESVGKGPKVVTPKDRAKMKKVSKGREKFVVSIVSGVTSSGAIKGIAYPKKPKGKSPFKEFNHLKGSGNIVRSSNELASGTCTHLLSKKGSNPLQHTNCAEGSKTVVTSTSKPSSGSTPQSSFKRRAIASSSGKTPVGASSKPVSIMESSPNLVNQLDGSGKSIDSSSEPSGRASLDATSVMDLTPGNVVSGGGSEPLPKMERSTLKEYNHPKGSETLAASFGELESSSCLQTSLKKTASSSSEAAGGSSAQILSKTKRPRQGFSNSDVSVKIIASSSKPLSGDSLASSVLPASNASTDKTENIIQVSNSSLGLEKVLVSSTKPLTGSNSKPSSKRKIVASRKAAGGTSTKPLCIADSDSVHVSNDIKESVKVEDSSGKPSGYSSFQKSSKRVITSSGKQVIGANSKSSFKRAVNMSAAKKNAAKRATKTIILVENHVSKDSGQEAKTRKGKPTDGQSSQLCQPGSMEVMASIEDSVAEQCIKDVNLVQGVDIEDTREEESSKPNEKIDQKSCYPVVPDSVITNDPSSEPFAQEITPIRTQSKGIALICIDTIEDQSKTLPHAVDDVGSLAPSNSKLAISSYDEFSSFGSVGDAAVIRSAVTESSISGHGTSKVRNVKRMRQILEEQHILELPAVSEGWEPAERMPEDGFVLLPSEASNLVVAQSPPYYDMGQEACAPTLVISDGSPPFDNLSMPDESLPIHTNDLTGEIKKQPLPLCISETDSLVEVPNIQDALNFTDVEWSNSMLSESKGCSENDDCNNQDEKPTTKSDFKSDETTQSNEPVFDKMQLLSSNEYKEEITRDAKLMEGKYLNRKTILSFGVPNISQNWMNSASSSKGTAHKNARNTTWHRSDTSFASQSYGNLQYGIGSHRDIKKKQSPKKLGRFVNPSYVRKGNSLIRKPTNQVLPPMPSLGPGVSGRKNSHLTGRSIFLGYKDNNSNHTIGNPSFERPKTPPLPLGTKLPNCSMDPLKDSSQLMSEDPIPDSSIEVHGIQLESQALDLVSGSVHNHNIPSGTSSDSLTRKRMIYVKHKSNQLVAAAQPAIGNTSGNLAEKTQKLSTSTLSDLYYRRKKNQLILNALSSDSQHKQDIDNVNLDDQGTSKVSSLECNTAKPFKNRLDKVLRKTYKHSQSSHVWMLNRGEPGKKGFTPANLRKVTPYLFPWKRTTYCQTSASRQSLSLISRKLHFTRKRDTIYKVSTDGYSLRKTGVVSIGGASLKWSKSIEKHSKKANEEATLAVAEVERRKRERQGSISIQTRKKNRNSLHRKSTFGTQLKRGERIFRVGSVRYKMDSSKRTLIRIPDEQSSSPVGQQSTSNTFVPRRLLIGNDEYIRIGNGNQLVRDPKKLVRILASEKVRWSLHTARSCLAKKKQYCQFFTRFGKCNKSAGKCPYIHDPAKVAICTKFLRGVCTESNCKLTHKVLPERMPDCSYFLQGLCTKIHCPYRHVNVNPNASVCDGFLRGYCADGDECCKKHNYVCPYLEETGKCAQGSKCKLHHPKSRKKSKKRKRRQVQSGRYFLSDIVKVGEPVVAASEKNDDRGGDALVSDEWGADFISIDPDSDYDDFEADSPGGLSPQELKDDLFDPDDLDSLVKPIRIMNKENAPAST